MNAIARFYIDLAIALGLIASCRVLNRHGWGCLDGHDHAWRT